MIGYDGVLVELFGREWLGREVVFAGYVALRRWFLEEGEDGLLTLHCLSVGEREVSFE